MTRGMRPVLRVWKIILGIIAPWLGLRLDFVLPWEIKCLWGFTTCIRTRAILGMSLRIAVVVMLLTGGTSSRTRRPFGIGRPVGILMLSGLSCSLVLKTLLGSFLRCVEVRCGCLLGLWVARRCLFCCPPLSPARWMSFTSLMSLMPVRPRACRRSLLFLSTLVLLRLGRSAGLLIASGTSWVPL